MKITYILASLLLMLNLSALAANPKDDKKKTEEATIGASFSEGIIYALPRTGLNITVKASKTTFVPGPYWQYAEKFLGIKGAKSVAGENWEMCSLKVDHISEADPGSIYKAMDSVASLISQLPDGIISGINTTTECVENGTIGGDFIVTENIPAFPITDLSSESFFDLIVDPATGNEKTEFKSTEEKAREAADYLMRLRKKRTYTIIDANDVVPEDGKGYSVFVNEAQRLEKEYLALFIGKTFTSKHKFNFTFFPGESNVKNDVLFRFSPEKGVLPKTDISGKPILLDVLKEEAAYSAIESLKKSENPDAGTSGIFYRMPCAASIRLSDGVNTLYSGRTTIGQFGLAIPLPEKLLNGKYQIKFNTETGSIKEILEKVK